MQINKKSICSPVESPFCYREIQCLCRAASPTKTDSYLRNKQTKTTFVFLYEKQIRGEQRRPTSILRLVPCLIPLPSDRSLPLASSSTQLQRAPVESKQHNTIEEQRSTIINNIGPNVYLPHKCIYHQTYKNVEENLNRFINIKSKQRGLQPIVLTQRHPPT